MATEESNPPAVTSSRDEQDDKEHSDSEAAPTSSIHDTNVQLEKLAQKCLHGADENVVLVASQCQDLFFASENMVDTVSFNIMLKAWKNACAVLAEHKQQHSVDSLDEPIIPVITARDAAERATNLLLEQEQNDDPPIIKPDTSSYNVVIDAWAKSRVDDAPQACERLLKRMLDNPNIEPDTISYNGVLEAWAHDRSAEGMERVLKIWRHMQHLYNDEHNEKVKPTMRTVNSVVTAHAKRVSSLRDHEEALATAKAAHDVLEEMKQVYESSNGDPDFQVDVMTYTFVMDAYARCGNLEATKCAEALLEELKEAYASTNNAKLQPNYRTYTSLITAWSKTRSAKSPHRCQELLEEMKLHEETKPNTRTYTGVIQAWARSRDPTKAQRALKLLQEMRTLSKDGDTNVKPNLITYTAAIDACARCQGDTKQQMEALKIAFAILKSIEMEELLEPNHLVYSALLRAAAYLLPAGEERNKVACTVLEKAKAAGMVDFNSIKTMRKAVDNHVMQNVLEEMVDKKGHINYKNIPPAWSRNVR